METSAEMARVAQEARRPRKDLGWNDGSLADAAVWFKK
jgi:hypothetical protein